MTFTVTYRGKDGAKAEAVIEVSSRAECVAECRRRGIAPVGIREGRDSDAGRQDARGGLRSQDRRRTVFAGVLGILAVMLLGVWWWLAGGAQGARSCRGGLPSASDQPKDGRRSKGRPASQTVEPNATENPVHPDAQTPDKNARPTKVGEELNGYIKLPSGRLHKVKGVVTNDFRKATQGKYAIFPHRCENEIACYLSLKPGDAIFGTMRYTGRFKDEFIKSLETPIVIDPGDPDDVKELKRNVREAKIQLKAALDRGEDIEQIMLDTRKELQDLAMYKMDLKRTIYEMRREKPMTADDLQDAVDAANRMLESKGIAPIRFGPLVRQKMLMSIEQERQKEQKQ